MKERQKHNNNNKERKKRKSGKKNTDADADVKRRIRIRIRIRKIHKSNNGEWYKESWHCHWHSPWLPSWLPTYGSLLLYFRLGLLYGPPLLPTQTQTERERGRDQKAKDNAKANNVYVMLMSVSCQAQLPHTHTHTCAYICWGTCVSACYIVIPGSWVLYGYYIGPGSQELAGAAFGPWPCHGGMWHTKKKKSHWLCNSLADWACSVNKTLHEAGTARAKGLSGVPKTMTEYDRRCRCSVREENVENKLMDWMIEKR